MTQKMTDDVQKEKETLQKIKKSHVQKEPDNKLVISSEIRFYSMIASVLTIKNYGSLPLPQLKLRIGTKLVEDSGLVKSK